MTSVGIFHHRADPLHPLWRQCAQPGGRDGDLVLRGRDAHADRLLVFTSPAPPGRRPTPPIALRLRPGAAGAERRRRWRLERAWAALGKARARAVALMYEPPPWVTDVEYAVAREQCPVVYGPDPRATVPIVLPATWEIGLEKPQLAVLEPAPRTTDLVAVISGKRKLPGHRARLAFLRRLREAGVPFRLHGRDLPPALGGHGPVPDKAPVYGAARLTLAIENHAEGDLYVTEKLWDPLLVWSLPLYFGSRAADRLIPPEAFVRLPDLGARGVETVREALADPTLHARRRDAIAEARRRILGPLNLVTWLHTLGPVPGPTPEA